MSGGSHGRRIESIFGFVEPVTKGNGGKQIVPSKSDYRVSQGGGQSSNFHQKTSRTNYMDKQTGKYSRATNKQVVSTGDTFKERSTGRVGYKDEHKTTFTYRVGDKRGYHEHQLEERVRRVDYSGSCNNNKKGKFISGSYNYNGGSGASAAISYNDGYNKYDESSSEEEEESEEYSSYGDSDDYDD